MSTPVVLDANSFTDAPLRLAAPQRKINSYRQQYSDTQNISFLPAIMPTSSRMHGEFLRLLFLQPTARPRRTSMPPDCHRKATIRTTRSGSSARHSTSRWRAKSASRRVKATLQINLNVDGCDIAAAQCKLLHALPFFSPSSFHTNSLSPTFTGA